ncbi:MULTISPECIES: LacI family DNA-binding transcriptional regulator [unclassified Martelella]|uniref:LacI family DNA-binding transcriptional regulator n=1 Tax=unclassified Martelella TaxID=2629616 RepID=UPI0025BF23A0|nr:LacI family DNA-binding transcriptional regulator [Martelella sp.]
MKARMIDVARMAGVSASTVSRRLSGSHLVSDDVGARIDAAVRALDYAPNAVASGLAGSRARGRSRTVAVIVPALAAFAAMTDELMVQLESGGYQVMIAATHYDAEREEALVRALLSWSPAALVMVGRCHSRAALQALLADGLPVVEVGELIDRPIDANIGFSHRAVGRTVARHFLAAGARRLGLAVVALPGDRRAADRALGLREIAAEADVPVIEHVSPERATTRAGATALADLMDRAEAPDAILCSNDLVALGALFEAGRRGLDLPRDLRLCGYGDFDFAAETPVPLSSVRPPDREIAREAAALLLARFAGRAPPPPADTDFTHLVRGTG